MKNLRVVVLATSLVGLPLTAALAQSQSPSGASTESPSASPSSSSPSMQRSGQSSGVQITANSIIGSKVRNPEGKEIGEVSQLLIDPQQGKVTSAVVSMGGTLGVGAKQVTVPWEQLKVAARPAAEGGRDDGPASAAAGTPQAEERQQQQNQQQNGSGDQGSPSASPSTSGQGSSPTKSAAPAWMLRLPEYPRLDTLPPALVHFAPPP